MPFTFYIQIRTDGSCEPNRETQNRGKIQVAISSRWEGVIDIALGIALETEQDVITYIIAYVMNTAGISIHCIRTYTETE